jgi:hydrogenase maturation protease
VLGGLDPAVPLIVLDALAAGGEPGTVYSARLEGLSAGGCLAGLGSLHELSVLPALRLEALSGRTFEDVTVFGVEPARVEWGEGLSDAAAAGVDRLVEAVSRHLDRITRDRLAIAGESLP